MLLACVIFIAVWPIVFGIIYAVLCRVERLLPIRKYFLLISGAIITIISIPLLIQAIHIMSERPDNSDMTTSRIYIASWYVLILPIILLGVLPIYFGVKGILNEYGKRHLELQEKDKAAGHGEG